MTAEPEMKLTLVEELGSSMMTLLQSLRDIPTTGTEEALDVVGLIEEDLGKIRKHYETLQEAE